MTVNETIYIIDASGFLYRAFFAIQGLSSRGGEATGALFGFIRSYLRLIKECDPKYIVAVFDAERSKESRLAIYKEYKAHRKPTPEELIQQIQEAKRFCQLANIPMLSVPGVEADDTIGSVASWAKSINKKACIVSGDKDMAQLINGSVFLMNPHKDNLIIDADKAKELYGVAPEQMRDFLAICGDASDNVPGISGFGPKTAIQLLEQYKTLENILEHAGQIGGKKAQTLTEQKELALISQKLVTIDTTVHFEQNLDFFTRGEPARDALWQFLQEKSFHSLVEPLLGVMSDKSSKTHYHTIDTEKALKELLHRLKTCDAICVDTETTDVHFMKARLVGIGLGVDGKDAYYIPYVESYRQWLAPFFADRSHGFYGHNIKYDLHVLENAGMPVGRVVADTILSSYLLNAHERRHSLDSLVLSLFGKKMIPISDLIGKGKTQKTMDEVPVEQISEYCCEDVACTIELKQALDQQIVSRGLSKLLEEVELPLLSVLQKMEHTGIFVDKNVLTEISGQVVREIERLEEEIYEMAGKAFNINSPKQLSEVLYIDMAIAAPKKGKTQPTTNADALQGLAHEHPIAQMIIDYRIVEKLRSTYIDALPDDINPKTGRVHCTFNQSVTATGRLSCQDPNLQNIPVRSHLGRSIRRAFRPQHEGWSFLSADYSQIELRILAHVCEDEGLIEAFNNNVDVHAYTAAQIFQVPLEAVTDVMRHQAKAVNFGIVYGQQAFGLSQALHIPVGAASAFIDAYFKRFSGVKKYIEEAKKRAHETGKATSFTGRERLLPDITSSNMTLRAQAERLAINSPIQAASADMLKMAMIGLDRWIEQRSLKTKMLLQIHDELIFEVPDGELDEVACAVREHMEGVFALKIPLVVKIDIGKNWEEC